MALRNRSGVWHYRFKLDGKEYSGTTDLAATKQNTSKAQDLEQEHLEALRDGRRPTRRIVVRRFIDAAKEFLDWAKMQHRAHPNSYRRIATSFASAKDFFGSEAVSLVEEGRIEAYKVWRVNDHQVRDVTLRHDLHALSKFFGYAVKQRWTRENPIRNVEIPSDADAIRMHILTSDEEKHYFSRATKHWDLHDLGRIMLNQGMRPDEVTALHRNDIDLGHGQLHIRQGKSSAARRTLDLTTESRQILASRMSGNCCGYFLRRGILVITSRGSMGRTIAYAGKLWRLELHSRSSSTISGTPLQRDWLKLVSTSPLSRQFSGTALSESFSDTCIRRLSTNEVLCCDTTRFSESKRIRLKSTGGRIDRGEACPLFVRPGGHSCPIFTHRGRPRTKCRNGAKCCDFRQLREKIGGAGRNRTDA
jgi:integrase